jgi:hemoglobin-like flavoprotein
MTEIEMKTFHESLERCLGSGEFVVRFYERLTHASPEIAAKFRGTDFEVQKRKLTASLYMVLLLDEHSPEGRIHFERIAQLHSKQALDIRPELYDRWVDTLVETVRDSDGEFDEDVERAWRSLLRPAVEFMRSRYERSAGPTDLDPGLDD